MKTLTDVKAAQPTWFSKENKRFFGDINYRVLHSGITKLPYLARSTYSWSDMFGREKEITYRLNLIENNNKIGHMLDEVFHSWSALKSWLKKV